MAKKAKQLRLGIQLMYNGGHQMAWRLPESACHVAASFAEQKRMALACERAKLHYIFTADNASVYDYTEDKDALSYNGRIDKFEPLTLMGALSVVTERIGFVATASTTYNEPYHIARKFASLDHISGGRVGWNVVTSWREGEARNFGLERGMDHGLRYRRAEEFVDVVMGLWDSWEDGAFIRDKRSGRYIDPAKLHLLKHKGEVFSVHGPLNIDRPVQGYPVIAQAGGSEAGRDLGARTADLIYTGHATVEEGVTFANDMRRRAAAAGRDPNSILIMPGIHTVIGRTMEEAREKNDRMDEMIHPNVGRAMIERVLGDISAYPDDGPIPPIPATTNGVKSLFASFVEIANDKNMTVRQLYLKLAQIIGPPRIVGTPESIADVMEHWLRSGACDGFSLTPSQFPHGLEDCLELLVPELQRRGLFRTEYEGATLRENLGLPRPGTFSRTKSVASTQIA